LHEDQTGIPSAMQKNPVHENEYSVPENQLLHKLVEQQITDYPQKIAVRLEEKTLTFLELHLASDRLAEQLFAKGIKNCIIGVVVERCCELIITLMAILKTGSCYLPMDPGHPRKRLQIILEEARPRCIISQEKWLPALGVSDCKLTKADLSFTPSFSARFFSSPMTTPDDIAYIMYTSGSTGKPKGVMISHLAVCNRLLWMRDFLQIDANDNILQKTPYTFDVSLWEFFLPLISGATLVLAKPQAHVDPFYISGIIKEQKITTVHFVPSMLSHYLSDTLSESNKSLRRVICSGEVLTAGLVNAFFKKIDSRLYNFYGPTEATIDVSAFECLKDAQMTEVPIGFPIANTRVYVLDEALKPVKGQKTGELYIAGVCLAKGYLKNPLLTSERFLPNHISPEFGDKLYRTGDLAYFLPDGNLVFAGRIDQQIKLRGYRIEPAEIEALIDSYTGVRKCAVVMQQMQETEPYLAAFVEVENRASILPDLIRSFLIEHLPTYMIPLHFIVIDQLPLTSSGKTDRKHLQETSIQKQLQTNDLDDPRYSIMIQIWKSLLTGVRFGIHTHFFACGGHSLLALRLTSLVRTTFNIEVKITDVFNFPTIASFVSNVIEPQTNRKDAFPNEIPSYPHQERYPLTSEQEGLAFLHFMDSNSSAYHIPSCLLINGKIDIQQIEETLQLLIKRHSALRTSVHLENGEFHQKVHDDVFWNMYYSEELLGKKFSFPIMQHVLKDHVQKRFDISCATLMRATLFKLNKDKYLLFIVFHHIISDAWSLRLFFHEFKIIYNSLLEEKAANLPVISCTFNNYSLWLHEEATKKNAENALLYWEKELEGIAGRISIGKVWQSPYKQGNDTHQFTSRLPKKLWEAIKSKAGMYETTPFIWLFTAFSVLLARLSGEEDIVVGVPFSCRDKPCLEQVIGYFVNTLPIRIDLTHKPAYRKAVRLVQEKVLEAFDHQSASFRKIVERCNPSRSAGKNPLFNCMFNFYEEITPAWVVKDVQFTPYKSSEIDSKVDLKLVITSAPGHATCIWECKKAIFTKNIESAIARLYQTLIQQTLIDPLAGIYDYSLEDPAIDKILFKVS